MPVTVKCSECGASYLLRGEVAGKRLKCKCGHAMILPRPDSEADDAVYGLAPPDASDPATPLDVVPPPEAEEPAGAAEDEAAEEPSPSPADSSRPALATGLGIVGGLALIGLILLCLALRPGFGSPEKAFAARQRAILKADWKDLIRAHSPQSRGTVIGGTVTMLGWFRQMVGTPTPTIDAALRKHGVEGLLETDDLADVFAETARNSEDAPPIDFAERARKREERRRRLLEGVENKVALFVDLMEAVEIEQEKRLPQNPLLALQAKRGDKAARRTMAEATLVDVEIDGDSAAGTMTFVLPGLDVEEEAPVEFRRVGGRWYVHVPGPEDYGDLLLSDLIGGGLIP